MKAVDTTFLIDVLRKRPDAVAKAIALDDEPFVFTTEANVYEIVVGIKKDAVLGHALSDLEKLLSTISVLQLDHKASVKAGLISRALMLKGEMIDDIDCLTAGILLTNGCNTIITRNAKHFEKIKEMKVERY
ncbi:MAG: type II toxin-antitoxin system VapC family toxin [Candidatus Aenigmatarchaeota archaeon]